MHKYVLSNKTFLFLVALIILLNFTGLFNEILEPDGTLYALLAKQMVVSGDWVNLYSFGQDWLDKPHLPFWLAAISFKLFGIHSFAYKLPSFICFIVALFYCYKLTKAIYSVEVAKLATLIFGTSLHIIISNFDGKAEVYLTAFILASIYHMYKAHAQKWFWHILAASFFMACAFMTKGVFSIITITAGFLFYWLKTKQWHQFVNIRWYFFLLLALVFTLPELYALYTQFDLHPSKIVFGKTNVSGLSFFFWDSQFGRFFNNGPIKGKGDISFFIHTYLWAFLPWALLSLVGIYQLFINTKKNTIQPKRWIIGASCLLTFLMFSFSKFQLPHYLIILFPHFSIFTAVYLIENASEKALKNISILQSILFFILVVAILSLTIVYTSINLIAITALLVLAMLCILFIKTPLYLAAIFKKNIVFAMLLAVFLNLFFYPSLLTYQSGTTAATWLNSMQIKKPVVVYNTTPHCFDFYYNGTVDYSITNLENNSILASNDSLLVYTPIEYLNKLNKDVVGISVLNSFSNFHVSQLNATFINEKTRKNCLDTFVVAYIFKRRGN
jgi:4-amino-4-deoxy-L-arabinose transferase-like glycosyltransferase